MRIDKYLWCVRLFKTRTQATDACKNGKILIQGENVKAGLELKTGETFTVKTGSLRYTYAVKGFPASRVGAKLVPEYLEDITSPEDKDRNELILQNKKDNAFYEQGRPTKKNRRDLDKWKEI
jgi:ribosome-associated heat shock protein Hsp15